MTLLLSDEMNERAYFSETLRQQACQERVISTQKSRKKQAIKRDSKNKQTKQT